MSLFHVYLGCFGFGLIFALVSGFMAGVFGGHDASGHEASGHDSGGTDGHAEAGFGSNDMPGFSPLSPTSLSTFVTAFGGLGVILDRIPATRSPWISVPFAALGALGCATAVVAAFRAVFRRTQASSEGHVATLVGQTANVITPIPAGGVGEIAYVQAGTRYTAPARSEAGTAIGNGSVVRISRIVGTQFFVVPD